MKPGQEIFNERLPEAGSVVVRYPKLSDAAAMCAYINILSKEKTFITFQGKQLSLAEERAHVRGILAGMKKETRVDLLLWRGKKLCGVGGINLSGAQSNNHVGILGISLAKNARGKRLGMLLMTLIMEEARQNLKGMRIIQLDVFGDNKVAKSMYKKFGFKACGSLPKGTRHGNKYVSHDSMYKSIK